jgi:hypothetical protein
MLENYQENKQSFDLPEYLPQPPNCRVLAIAASQSGKSNFLMSLLHDFLIKIVNGKKQSIFKEIYIFAQSADQDPLFKNSLKGSFLEKITYLSNEFDQDMISEILQLENDGKTYRLIWIDDFYNDRKLLETPLIKNMFYKARQNLTSIFLCAQDFYAIPPDLRVNASHIALFPINNHNRLGLIKSELQTKQVDQDHIEKFLNEATESKYGFLWIKMSNPRKFYASLEYEFIINKQEQEQKEEKLYEHKDNEINEYKN